MTTKMLTMAILGALIVATPALADTTAYNSTPADRWQYGKAGNDTTNDTAVLSTAAGDQLYLRWKEYNVGSSGSDANGVYHFNYGQILNYDWGFDTSGTFPANDRAQTVARDARITITNLATGGFFSYLASGDTSDTYYDRGTTTYNGSAQNSDRLTFGFLAPVGYDPNADGTYRLALSVGGLTGGTRTFSVDAVVGAGAVLPEPATWGMMILGFGLIGATIRRRIRRSEEMFDRRIRGIAAGEIA